MKESRIIYGFLEKRHKTATHLYQKRWLFLISSRPLTDEAYQNDENELESKILPSFISFDDLYYYEFENELDGSESKGKISLKYNNVKQASVMDYKFMMKMINSI